MTNKYITIKSVLLLFLLINIIPISSAFTLPNSINNFNPNLNYKLFYKSFSETYYYLYDKLVGKKDANGNTLFFHPDHLGSTRLITDINGNTVADLSYKPYGELIKNEFN